MEEVEDATMMLENKKSVREKELVIGRYIFDMSFVDFPTTLSIKSRHLSIVQSRLFFKEMMPCVVVISSSLSVFHRLLIIDSILVSYIILPISHCISPADYH